MMMLRQGAASPAPRSGRRAASSASSSRRCSLMQFTPTKWTHHFGVYAGLAAPSPCSPPSRVSASSMRSKRNRTLFAAAVLFILAAGVHRLQRLVVRLELRRAVVGQAAVHRRQGLLDGASSASRSSRCCWPPGTTSCEPRGETARSQRQRRPAPTSRCLAPSPLTLAAGAVVLFEVLSLLKGAVAQYPAYSIGKLQPRSPSPAERCGLADDVLVETDPERVLQLLDPPTDPRRRRTHSVPPNRPVSRRTVSPATSPPTPRTSRQEAQTASTATHRLRHPATHRHRSGTGGGTTADRGRQRQHGRAARSASTPRQRRCSAATAGAPEPRR